jgi:uncharacterized repeat protein (TIGR03803 family)
MKKCARCLALVTLLLAPPATAAAQFRFEVVHAFNGISGAHFPVAALLETNDGSLCGTTANGGVNDAGVVFQLLPDRTIVNRDLQPATTGKTPLAGLVRTSDGTFYGTTQNGGADSSGTFFKMSASGAFTTYDLPAAGKCGFFPVSGPGPTVSLTPAADGNLYVPITDPKLTNLSCQTLVRGGVIRLTPGGQLTRFEAPAQEGIIVPTGALVASAAGKLYGSFVQYGTFQDKAYSFAAGQFEVVHTFTPAEGTSVNTLLAAPDLNFYGTAFAGGAANKGTIFRMSSVGVVTVLHDFQGGTDGAAPRAGLVLAGDGALYGVTSQGGASDVGTIFRITLDGAYQVIYAFSGGDDGEQPWAALIQSRDGSLYGTTMSGGPLGGGVVFRITPTASHPALLIDSPIAGASVGTSPKVEGWAIDHGAFVGTGIDAIHVYAYPNPGSGAAPIFLGVATHGAPRPDVGTLFGSRFTNSGFSLTATPLAPGLYEVAVFGHSTVTGTFATVATRRMTVVGPTPMMALDGPASGATTTSPITVAGWAIDAGDFSGTGVDAVHAWAFPEDGRPSRFFGVATYGLSRPDVGAIFGTRFTSSGYTLTAPLPPGRYTIAAFARSILTGTFTNVRTAEHVVVESQAAMALDGPAAGATTASPITVAGWAIDAADASGTGVTAVHVWALPEDGRPAQFLGVATYGLSRPDLGAIFGARFTNSGYTLTAPLDPGTYTIAAFARSTATALFDNVRTTEHVVVR